LGPAVAWMAPLGSEFSCRTAAAGCLDAGKQASPRTSRGAAGATGPPVVLVTGLILVPEMHLDFSDLWVVLGLAAVFLSLLLGATMIRGTNAELRRLAAGSMQESPRWAALQRRAAALYGINLVLLLSVVWAMVFQPTL